MTEHATERDRPWSWCVADGANPERQYSLLDVNHFPPEFGPFETREAAEEFAAMRPAYYVTQLREPRMPKPSTEIVRVDRYTIEVNGTRVRATEDQERRLRAMTPEQVTNFLHIMGADR